LPFCYHGKKESIASPGDNVILQNYHNQKAIRTKLYFFTLFIFILGSFFIASPQADCQLTEWNIQISIKRLDYFLNYQGSLLAPVIQVSISYSQFGQNVQYERLYYSNNIAIGCRQSHAFNIQPGTAGTITITNLSDNNPSLGIAAANASLRTYLDLYVLKAPLKNLTVSPDFFDNLLQGLGNYGLQPFEIVPDKPYSATFVMEVDSNPQGRVQYLFYD